jgi:hypothetical protein
MFRHAKIPWERVLQGSVEVILSRYGITAGCLGLDDSEKRRSKVTTQIAHVHKLDQRGHPNKNQRFGLTGEVA